MEIENIIEELQEKVVAVDEAIIVLTKEMGNKHSLSFLEISESILNKEICLKTHLKIVISELYKVAEIKNSLKAIQASL